MHITLATFPPLKGMAKLYVSFCQSGTVILFSLLIFRPHRSKSIHSSTWNNGVSMSSRIARLFILLSLVILGVGCSGEDPHPERKDPIYGDLKDEHAKHIKMLEEAEKVLATVEKEMESIEPRSIDRKIKNREYQKALSSIVKIREMVEYYRIKAELRRVYGRKAYKVAFQKGEKWPDAKEFKDYNVNKKLRAAPRNWSHRVPKSKHQQITDDDMKKASEE